MEQIIGIKSFYQPDLKVVNFHRKDIEKSIVIGSNEGYESYFLCYVYEGLLDYHNAHGIFELKKGDFVVCMPYEKYQIICPPTKVVKYLLVQFEQSVVSAVNQNLSLLRAFNERKQFENNVYKISEMQNGEFVKSLFDTTRFYIEKNLERPHYVAWLMMLLSEICAHFDINNKSQVQKYSQEYDVRIYDYICRNSCENVTIEMVEKKFFVSKWYINKLCNRFYNMPFKEMVVDLRMWHAREIMRNSSPKLRAVFELCGYKEYSGFFKAYKKFFGVSPSADYNNYKSTGTFLTK